MVCLRLLGVVRLHTLHSPPVPGIQRARGERPPADPSPCCTAALGQTDTKADGQAEEEGEDVPQIVGSVRARGVRAAVQRVGGQGCTGLTLPSLIRYLSL